MPADPDSPAGGDYLTPLGVSERGTYLGLEHQETEDDYTGEARGAQWVEPFQPDELVRRRQPPAERIRSAQAVFDLANAGHGYLVQTVTRDESITVQTTCRFCGGPLPTPQKDWLCELVYERGAEPDPACRCNWCVLRRQWEERQYRDAGRPRTQCDSDDCKRQARNEYTRRYRAKKRQERDLVGV